MQCIFNQPRKLGGQIYPKAKAAQKVDDKHYAHWFFKEMVKAGDIVVVGAEPKVKDTKDSKTPVGSKAKALVAAASKESEVESEDEDDAEEAEEKADKKGN